MQTPSQHDRFLGATVGTLAGDAYGAPVEWFSPDRVSGYFNWLGYDFRDYENPWDIKRGKIPPSIIKAGQPTDDSELAAALATSLVAKRGLDPEDLYGRMRSFIIDRKSILTDKAFGKGGTLEDALQTPTYAESLQRFDAGQVRTPPSNGSLMRCIGIPLCYLGQSSEAMIEQARKQSLVTHRNEESVITCAAFSILVSFVLYGYAPAAAWQRAVWFFNRHPAFAAMAALPTTKPDYETEMMGKEGYCVLSLRVAVWASTTAQSFEDGIRKAVEVGGDTDTYAAIAGGILGAHFGYQGIPVAWRSALQGREIMERLGSELYDLHITLN